MARTKLNPVFNSFRGKIGELVFKQFGSSTIVARTPDSSGRVFTQNQLEVQERFRQAVQYGKLVMADPQAKALYEEAAESREKPLFSLMVADFFNEPTVDEIDLSQYTAHAGSSILVRATDDFEVMSVDVSVINTTNGAVIETGAATKSAESGRWIYVATVDVPPGTPIRIEATASDRPGHKTKKSETVN